MENCIVNENINNDFPSQSYSQGIGRITGTKDNIFNFQIPKELLEVREKTWDNLFDKYFKAMSDDIELNVDTLKPEGKEDEKAVSGEESSYGQRILMRKPATLVQYWINTGNLPYKALLNEKDELSETGSSLSEKEITSLVSPSASPITNVVHTVNNAADDKRKCKNNSSCSSVDTAAYILSNANITKMDTFHEKQILENVISEIIAKDTSMTTLHRKKLYTGRDSPIDIILTETHGTNRLSQTKQSLCPAFDPDDTIKRKEKVKRKETDEDDFVQLIHPRKRFKVSINDNTLGKASIAEKKNGNNLSTVIFSSKKIVQKNIRSIKEKKEYNKIVEIKSFDSDMQTATTSLQPYENERFMFFSSENDDNATDNLDKYKKIRISFFDSKKIINYNSKRHSNGALKKTGVDHKDIDIICFQTKTYDTSSSDSEESNS